MIEEQARRVADLGLSGWPNCRNDYVAISMTCMFEALFQLARHLSN